MAPGPLSMEYVRGVYFPVSLIIVGAATQKPEWLPYAVIVAVVGAIYAIRRNATRKVLKPDEFQDFTLKEKKVSSHNVSVYRFELPKPTDILGLPIGQHISLAATPAGAEKEVVRSYTPISSDDDSGFFDLLIKSYPQGNISAHMATLEVGQTMRVKGPKGAMKYTPNMRKRFGMIAGGTGITPMLQIIRAIIKGRPRNGGDDRTEVDLIFANVNPEDILMKSHLDRLETEDEGFRVHYVLNNPPDHWSGGTGFVTPDMIKSTLPPPGPDMKLLICGPPPMVSAMKKATESLGYTKARPVICTVPWVGNKPYAAISPLSPFYTPNKFYLLPSLRAIRRLSEHVAAFKVNGERPFSGLSARNMASQTLYPSLNPVDIYREHISSILGPILGLEPAVVSPKLQWMVKLEQGDLMLPVPALQIKGKKPQQIATDIGEQFPESDLVEKPMVNGTFLQFFFKSQPLTKTVLGSILGNKASYGTNPNLGLRDPSDASKGKKKIIVEFSSPNIAKPFHAGHLRSTIIGGFIAKLYAAIGWDVWKMNYLGDWGKQYGLLANGYKKYGQEELLMRDPINHLFDVYVRINQDSAQQEAPIKELKERIKLGKAKGEDVTGLEEELSGLVAASEDEKARRYFKSMEDGDQDALVLWERFRGLSISKYKETYARLNIDFDEYAGESKVPGEEIAKVSRELADTKVSEDSNGATIVDFEKHGAKKLGKAVFQRKDGTPLYLTRDIAEIRVRHDRHHFDKMIYVVAAQQDLHLAQFFKVTELSGHKDIADKCQHINFGMVRGMSTRRGTVKFLDDILRDVADKMHEVMRRNETKYEQIEHPEQVADTLGITAVMVQDMSGKRINGYDFNLDAMTSFEGDTGPYLQYAHARLCSIERKSEVDVSKLSSANFSLLQERHACDLVRLLAQWPDVVQNTVKTLEPATVLTYLFRMTHALSSSYDVLKVIGSEPELKDARLALYEASRQVLRNGMSLLGLNPVQRM